MAESIAYPAVITTEGRHTLAEFPDCPGCQTFIEPGEDILAIAQEALEGWLESYLAHGEAPPAPSVYVRVPTGSTVLRVPVSPALAADLQQRRME